MKPSQLATFLAKAITEQLNVLIVGGPGVGKTSIIKLAAQLANAQLVISHPAVADPTDAKGFPWMDKGDKHASFKPFGDLARVLSAGEQLLLWFLDDLGQAPASVQASYMPWLLERQCAGNHLPENVVVMAATNRRTDRANVSGVLEPVKSRFAAIVTLEPDVDEWCEWALKKPKMPPEVVAYIRFQPDDLNQFVPTADLVNCPVPRTWEAAGRIIKLGLPADIEAAALTGAIGEGTTAKLMGFLRMFRALPSIDAILQNPNGAAIPHETNVLYAVSTALASRADAQNCGKIFRYAERLVEANHGEFAALTLLDSCRRDPKIMLTPHYVKLAAGELGQLIGGGVR